MAPVTSSNPVSKTKQMPCHCNLLTPTQTMQRAAHCQRSAPSLSGAPGRDAVLCVAPLVCERGFGMW